MKHKLYLIDGTGPSNWPEYWTDMGRGFCAKLKQQNTAHAHYLRGPTISGKETWMIAELMLSVIKEDLRDNARTKIILAGHSRGGSSAIYIAQQLKKDKVDVHGMVLFDAVRRAIQKTPADYAAGMLSAGSVPELAYQAVRTGVEVAMDFMGTNSIDIIPGNVERALHVVRDEEFSYFFQRTKEWQELEDKVGIAAFSSAPTRDARIKRFRELRDMHRAMRSACRFNCATDGGMPTGFSFGNTGLVAEPPCKLAPIEKHRFKATHGAMGGAPLDPYKYIKDEDYAEQIERQERASMREIAVRVNGFLRELGVSGEI